VSAIEAAKMTDEDLGDAMQAILLAWSARTHPAMQASIAAADLGRRVRELFRAIPTLPPEPPPGFVRATVWVATGEDGSKFYAAENREEVETVAIDNGLMPYRVSRISGDFPLVGVAEITGVVTP